MSAPAAAVLPLAAHPVGAHPLRSLFEARRARSARSSSWDTSGANRDFVHVGPGETAVLLDVDGPGCVTHLYCALVLPDLREHRNAVLRCYWDGADRPSVEVPLGDFFGLAHGRVRELSSALVAVNPGMGASHGLNAYFPMPFAEGARITVENRGAAPLGGPLGALWFHVEHERYDDPLPGGVDRFHACYRQERPTQAEGDAPNVTLHEAANLDGAGNYVALDTRGAGRMVGLVLQVDNRQGERWYGEGDDMVFVDGAPWPPAIHGTGSEEIFGGGACPSTEYAGAYSGFHLVESPRYDGLVGAYRWYLNDPIHFAHSLRWTVEHGHANNFANHYASVAYWYQSPAADLPPLPAAADMEPPLGAGYDEALSALYAAVERARADQSDPAAAMSRFLRVCQVGAPLYRGDWEGTLDGLERLEQEERP